MKFVRVYLGANGQPVGVMESPHPFESAAINNPKTGDPLTHVDLGIVEADQWVDEGGNPCSPSMAVWQAIERHPLADSHPDAPKVSFKKAHEKKFRAQWCPTSRAAIMAHLTAPGGNGLPDRVRAHLRSMWWDRGDLGAREFHALGFTLEQIKSLPRFRAERERLAQASEQGRQQASIKKREQISAERIARALDKRRLK